MERQSLDDDDFIPRNRLQPTGSAGNAFSRSFCFNLVVGLLLVSPGCKLWTRGELNRYQHENQRLLEDFRGQRERAATLEIEKRALVARVKELESRIATISSVLEGSAGLRNASAGPIPTTERSNDFRSSTASADFSPPTSPERSSMDLQTASALDPWQPQ